MFGRLFERGKVLKYKNRFLFIVFIFCLLAGRWEMAIAQSGNLSLTQAAIIPIAAFTAAGDTEKLKGAFEAGLDAGLTINEIREILIQMYAYAGFPRALTGISTFMSVLDERKKRNINDPVGVGPKKLPPDADKYAIGEKIQTALVGKPVTGPLYEFCPDIGVFLKEHLFCDIFARDLLSVQERELATISALAALPAPAQLASHFRVCLNTGISADQLREFVRILGEKVGKKQEKLAADVLDTVLSKNG